MGWRTYGAIPRSFQYPRERYKVSRKMTELVSRGKIQSAAATMRLTRYKPGIQLFNLNSPNRGLSPTRIHPLVELQQHPDPGVHLGNIVLTDGSRK